VVVEVVGEYSGFNLRVNVLTKWHDADDLTLNHQLSLGSSPDVADDLFLISLLSLVRLSMLDFSSFITHDTDFTLLKLPLHNKTLHPTADRG
jgi:hypothetical protein